MIDLDRKGGRRRWKLHLPNRPGADGGGRGGGARPQAQVQEVLRLQAVSDQTHAKLVLQAWLRTAVAICHL